MSRWIPRSIPLLVALAVVACADDSTLTRDGASSPLSASGKSSDCPYAADFAAVFPDNQETQAIAKCANVLNDLAKGKDEVATMKAFTLLEQTLRLVADGDIVDLDALAALFNTLFADLGIDLGLTADALADGEIGAGQVTPGGGTVQTPSSHAAADFDSGDVSDNTWVVITRLEDPRFPHDCFPGFPGFDLDPGHDCYPQYYDYQVFPEGNVVSDVVIGQCVVDAGPFAPDAATLARIRLGTPHPADPNTILALPLVAAPAVVDCTDLVVLDDWRQDLWDMLGPFQQVFSVTPAYASPGPLGASVSAFSPKIPFDTAPSGPRTDGQGFLDGVGGAQIELYGDVRPGLTGSFTVVFHAVDDPDVGGKTFVATSVIEYNEFTPTSGTCDAASNFVMEGELDGVGGHYVIARFGDGGSTGHDDTGRIQVFGPGPPVPSSGTTSGGLYDTFGDPDFASESSCVGSARTGLDSGDFVIELMP